MMTTQQSNLEIKENERTRELIGVGFVKFGRDIAGSFDGFSLECGIVCLGTDTSGNMRFEATSERAVTIRASHNSESRLPAVGEGGELSIHIDEAYGGAIFHSLKATVVYSLIKGDEKIIKFQWLERMEA